VAIGMEANFRVASGTIIFLMAMFAVVIVAKLIGSWMATRKDFDIFRERVLIGFGTLPQGEMGILVAAYLFSRGIVSPPSFNAAILLVIMVTMIVPMVMRVVEKLSLGEAPATRKSHEIVSLRSQ